MSILNIISAIGNNNSVAPLFVRDCCIEIPTKVGMTYNQNKSDKTVRYLATRERLVDEYTTSAVWLGGIPLIEKICKTIIKKKGYNPDIDTKLFKEDKFQNVDINIEKFKDKAPKEVKELEFLKTNKKAYMKLIGGKVFAESVVPMLLMGFVIPKLIFAWTAKTKDKLEKTKGVDFSKASKMQKIDKPVVKESQPNEESNISFKGNLISDMAGLSTVQKMFVTDGGYSVGRVLTARNGFAALDIGFKMLGMLYLNFLFPKTLSKVLNSGMGKLANTNLNLDIKMLADKKFIDAIKNNQIEIPKTKTGEELLEFVDKNPDNIFVQYAKKFNKIQALENGVRDPRKYVDIEKLQEFRDDVANIIEKAMNSKDINKFMKKTKILKGVNILANVGISSFLLAWGLPKAQFAFREKVTKCELEPGILD